MSTLVDPSLPRIDALSTKLLLTTVQVLDDSRATYTLMMVDPDAPTPDDPKFAFWRHWIVTGLQPLSGDSSVVAATKFPVTGYHPPGPKAE